MTRSALFPARPMVGPLSPLLLLLLASACSGSREVAPPQPVLPPAEVLRLSLPEVEDRLRTQTQAWEGVPYQWGGTSRRGLDCSAFVQILYREALGIRLPRTTAQQRLVGTPIEKEALQTGDLVFFYTPEKTQHVGVYLSDGTFAHASTSQGVTTSPLDLAYWRGAYRTARRLLPTAPSAEKPPSTTAEERIGW